MPFTRSIIYVLLFVAVRIVEGFPSLLFLGMERWNPIPWNRSLFFLFRRKASEPSKKIRKKIMFLKGYEGGVKKQIG
jgi:hypothetical protein